MPRTTFRLRVAPILHIEMELQGENTPDLKDKKKIYRQEVGDWSSIVNITTLDT